MVKLILDKRDIIDLILHIGKGSHQQNYSYQVGIENNDSVFGIKLGDTFNVGAQKG